MEILNFGQDGRYVNLSRCDPKILFARPTTWSGDRYEVCVSTTDTAICVTPVIVQSSHIRSPKRTKYPACELSGWLFSEEFSRFFAVLGMLIREDTIGINMYMDAITFANKGPKSAMVQTPDDKPEQPPAYFNTKASPVKKAADRGPQYKSVPAEGNVPVLEYKDPSESFSVTFYILLMASASSQSRRTIAGTRPFLWHTLRRLSIRWERCIPFTPGKSPRNPSSW